MPMPPAAEQDAAKPAESAEATPTDATDEDSRQNG